MTQTTLFDETVDRVIGKERSLRAASSFVFVIDEKLSILTVNNKEVQKDDGSLMRPGDYLQCINALEGPEGCGSHANCRYCRLRCAAQSAFKNTKMVMDECAVQPKGEDKVSLEITIMPFSIAGKQYAIVFATDITARKQKQVMDRVFFHDILNLMGALNGFVQLLLDEPDMELLQEVKKLSEQVISSVSYQKDIMNAENCTLALLPTEMSLHSFIADASISLESTAQNFNCHLDIIDETTHDVPMKADGRLLHRIILNMTKNAVEASPTGGTVTLRTQIDEDSHSVVFSVHNTSVIPKEYRKRIFKFGQSTKGIGRGLGTYSMKLFGERYLKGHVWFTSSQKEGTTFYFRLPLSNT